MFNYPQNIYASMKMLNNNPPFGGKRPIDKACEGLDGLFSVYQAPSSLAAQ
jgi:hypothetical protein